MAKKRKPKLPKKIVPQEEEAPLKKEEEEDTEANTEEDQLLKRRRTALPDRQIEGEDDEDYENPPAEWMEENLCFCCAHCDCAVWGDCDKEKMDLEEVYPYICASAQALPHRTCCHNADKSDRAWASPCEKAQLLFSDVLMGEKAMEELQLRQPPLEWIDKKVIKSSYNTARSQQSALYNADGLETAVSALYTHPDYKEDIEVPYKKLVQDLEDGTKKRRPAVVLDAFAGVGTGIVTLKRLGIAISKIIHVEHDKVASHVHKYNHDPAYNPDLKDDGDIKHVYEYRKWEDLYKEPLVDSIGEFVEKHGPVDIIIGGPPCVDYSRVNAYRKGSQGLQGQYMLQLGSFCRSLERIQHPHPLLFCGENVWLEDKDRESVSRAFGLDWDPIALDALYLSPTRRNRHFLTNIPQSDIDYGSDLSHLSPKDCLEEGFYVPAQLLDKDVTAKAQCLMGSKTGIDEPNTTRMYVFHETPDRRGRYHGRPMTVTERELLMGYKEGYVRDAVESLFQTLWNSALAITSRGQTPWTEQLPAQYHTFAGNYHALPVSDSYRFEVVKEEEEEGFSPVIRILMAPPVSRDTAEPSFFNADDYSKHLIGMAYSVPVMEHLLSPLQKIFESRTYEGYDYKFAWHYGKKLPKEEETA